MTKTGWLCAAAATSLLWPLDSRAVTQDNFLVQTTRDIVELCTADSTDPLRDKAIHFCHGFLVGAFHYHISIFPVRGPGAPFCMPDPPPSRDQAISAFTSWIGANPQYWNDRPVDVEFRWLAIAYPCR